MPACQDIDFRLPACLIHSECRAFVGTHPTHTHRLRQSSEPISGSCGNVFAAELFLISRDWQCDKRDKVAPVCVSYQSWWTRIKLNLKGELAGWLRSSRILRHVYRSQCWKFVLWDLQANSVAGRLTPVLSTSPILLTRKHLRSLVWFKATCFCDEGIFYTDLITVYLYQGFSEQNIFHMTFAKVLYFTLCFLFCSGTMNLNHCEWLVSEALYQVCIIIYCIYT